MYVGMRVAGKGGISPALRRVGKDGMSDGLGRERCGCDLKALAAMMTFTYFV